MAERGLQPPLTKTPPSLSKYTGRGRHHEQENFDGRAVGVFGRSDVSNDRGGTARPATPTDDRPGRLCRERATAEGKVGADRRAGRTTQRAANALHRTASGRVESNYEAAFGLRGPGNHSRTIPGCDASAARHHNGEHHASPAGRNPVRRSVGPTQPRSTRARQSRTGGRAWQTWRGFSGTGLAAAPWTRQAKLPQQQAAHSLSPT